MTGLEESKSVWRYKVKDPDAFDKFRVRPLGKGVKVTLGRLKGSTRWEVADYLFVKARFNSADQVRNWVDQHLKSAIDPKSPLNYSVFNEYKRQALNAYLEISKVK